MSLHFLGSACRPGSRINFTGIEEILIEILDFERGVSLINPCAGHADEQADAHAQHAGNKEYSLSSQQKPPVFEKRHRRRDRVVNSVTVVFQVILRKIHVVLNCSAIQDNAGTGCLTNRHQRFKSAQCRSFFGTVGNEKNVVGLQSHVSGFSRKDLLQVQGQFRASRGPGSHAQDLRFLRCRRTVKSFCQR